MRRSLLLIPDDGEWLPLARAAEITGQALRTWRWRARCEADAAQRQRRRALAVKAPPPNGRGRDTWWVHNTLDPRLAPRSSEDQAATVARAALVASYLRHHVERAYRKHRWLHEWRKQCDAGRDRGDTERTLAERVVRRAKTIEGESFRISFRALQHWWRAYNRIGPSGKILGLEGLVYGSRTTPVRDANGETSVGGVRRSAGAVEYFYALYHTQSRLTVEMCHQATLRAARKNDWSWSAGYSATLKWLRDHDDRSITCLMREGRDAWCRRFMPHLQIDYARIEPGQMFQTDHHRCDFWVEQDGQQLRPWLTVVQDLRSRAICGWHLGPRPHQDAIVSAYLMAFRDWAIPKRLRIDNGRDYTSRLLTGVTKATRDRLRRAHGPRWRDVLRREASLVDCVDPRFMGITAELGIELVYAIPYAPWSKGVTERWFETFESRCGKTFLTYCGRSSLTRPECLEVLRHGHTREQRRRLRKRHGPDWKKALALKLVDGNGLPTLDEACAAIGDFIEEYHHAPHGADDMRGLTPLQMWRTGRSLRRASADALLFLMQSRGLYTVQANGVSFKVGGTTLRYGQGNPALYRWTGRKVFVTVDPNDLSHCYAFTPDRENRRFIGRLDANGRISPMAGVDELRACSATVTRRRKIMHQATRDAPARTRTAVTELNAQRRQRLAELHATGADEASHAPVIVPVTTGFEGAVLAAKTADRAKSSRNRRSSDLMAAEAALATGIRLPSIRRRRPRASDALLGDGWITPAGAADQDGVDGDDSDAARPAADVFLYLSSGAHGDE